MKGNKDMSKEQIFEKAQEIADLIAHSDEKKAAQEASRHLMEDKEASELISGYNEKRDAKISEYQGKEPTQEDIEAVNEYLQGEFNKIMKNQIIHDYVQATRTFEMMLSQMDNIIKQGVAPEHSGGCGCSCDSCSGCNH